MEIDQDNWKQKKVVFTLTYYNVVLRNEQIAKVNGIINYQERIFIYKSNYKMNQIPIFYWQKF